MYDRNLYFKSDAYGNDPLTNTLIDKLPLVPIKTRYQITAAEECRIDILAFKLLGTLELWWLLLEFNNLFSVNELRVGTIVYVPDITFLNQVLLDARNRQRSDRVIIIK